LKKSKAIKGSLWGCSILKKKMQVLEVENFWRDMTYQLLVCFPCKDSEYYSQEEI